MCAQVNVLHTKWTCFCGCCSFYRFFFFQAEDGIRDLTVTGVQTCALPISVLSDGVLVAAAEEERFTRKKHDYEFPQHAIDFCLKAGGLAAGDLDYVAFFEIGRASCRERV